MRLLLIIPVLSLLAAPSLAQEVVKVPAKEAPTVSRPDDLFALPPGQWHLRQAAVERQRALRQPALRGRLHQRRPGGKRRAV